MQKLFIFSMLSLLAIATAKADNQHYVTFRQVDGLERSLPLEGLQITFHDGQMDVTCNQEAFVWDLVNTQSMRFASEPATGVERLSTSNSEVPAICYDLFGRRVNSTDGQIPGIYIIKNGEGARKEIKRW